MSEEGAGKIVVRESLDERIAHLEENSRKKDRLSILRAGFWTWYLIFLIYTSYRMSADFKSPVHDPRFGLSGDLGYWIGYLMSTSLMAWVPAIVVAWAIKANRKSRSFRG